MPGASGGRSGSWPWRRENALIAAPSYWAPPLRTARPTRWIPADCRMSMTLTTASYLTALSAEMTTGVAAWPACACLTRAARAPSCSGSASPWSTLSLSFSSLPTTTWITCSGCALLRPTLGRSTTPVVISGALTMKMISSTSITSMKGTMFISLMVRRREPRREEATPGMGSVPRRAHRGLGVALQDVGELLDEGLHVDRDAVDVAREAVVGDHRRD